MSDILVDDKFKSLITKHGMARTARILHCRYSAVREAAESAGIQIKRGRRQAKSIVERNGKIREMRTEKKAFLHTIGRKFRIGRERVRQILVETGGDPLKGKR